MPKYWLFRRLRPSLTPDVRREEGMVEDVKGFCAEEQIDALMDRGTRGAGQRLPAYTSKPRTVLRCRSPWLKLPNPTVEKAAGLIRLPPATEESLIQKG